MSSTTGHSTRKINNIAMDGTEFYVDGKEKKLDFPPNGAVLKVIPNSIEEEIMEIPVGIARVYENGTLEMQDGTKIKMANAKAYQNMAKRRDESSQMKVKAEQKTKKQAEIEIG